MDFLGQPSRDNMVSAHFHDPHRYGHLPLASSGASEIMPPPISGIRFSRTAHLSNFVQKSYLSETPTYLKKGSDTSLYAAPPRGVFLVRLDVPLGTSGHFIALEETFNYEKHPPPNLGRYIADLRREYGLTAFEAAKLHAEAISQIDFEALCAPVSWGSRIAPKTWQGYGVYKDEYNVLREIVVDREDAVARAFALEVQEANQVEITESGPKVLAHLKKQDSHKKSKIGGTSSAPSAPPSQRAEVRRRYDRLVPVQKVSLVRDTNCHLCHCTKKMEAIKFGDCHHAFCNSHCLLKYGMSAREIRASQIGIKCPVCIVTCVCSSCEKRLDKLCFQMMKNRVTDKQALNEIQWNPPAPTKAGIVACGAFFKTPTFRSDASGRKRRAEGRGARIDPDATRKSGRPRKGTKFLSIGSEDFMDINDAAYEQEHFRVPEDEEDYDSVKLDLEEDGNTDFCMMCKLGGGLLCCDFCPRAFHPNCLGVDEETLPDGDWRCPSCTRDTKFSKSDVLKHKLAVEDKNLALLGSLVEHLSMKVDFGYAFREPVDLKALHDYDRVVERPLAYDQISKKVKTGFYTEGDCSLNRTYSNILIDINTVFQNCYRYNNEGSAIYRMAEVHEKNFLKVLTGNDFNFDKEVTNELDKFLKCQKNEREVYLRLCRRRAELVQRALNHNTRRDIANTLYFRDAQMGFGKIKEYCNAPCSPKPPHSPAKKGKSLSGFASPSGKISPGGKQTPTPNVGNNHSTGKKIALVDCETGEFLDTYPNLTMMLKRMKFYTPEGQFIEGGHKFQTMTPDAVKSSRKIWEVYKKKEDMRAGKNGFKAFWCVIHTLKFMYQDVSFVELEGGWTSGAKEGGKEGRKSASTASAVKEQKQEEKGGKEMEEVGEVGEVEEVKEDEGFLRSTNLAHDESYNEERGGSDASGESGEYSDGMLVI